MRKAKYQGLFGKLIDGLIDYQKMRLLKTLVNHFVEKLSESSNQHFHSNFVLKFAFQTSPGLKLQVEYYNAEDFFIISLVQSVF